MLVLRVLMEYYTYKHFRPKSHSVNKEVMDPFLQVGIEELWILGPDNCMCLAFVEFLL